MRSSMRILAREHLALRAVARILAMEAALLARDGQADMDLLDTIARYITEYPNRIHHPKEENFLFHYMRVRAPARCADILDRLLSEHNKEHDAVTRFQNALAACRAGQPGASGELAQVAASYAKYLERHMDVENTQAFPLAIEVLQDADWDAIDAAFEANDDPLLGNTPAAPFLALHARIMALGAMPPGV